MFIISIISPWRHACRPMFSCAAFDFGSPGENKKTPAYAEYVEIHQKHNMKFLAFFSVVASRQISPHFPMCKGTAFSGITNSFPEVWVGDSANNLN